MTDEFINEYVIKIKLQGIEENSAYFEILESNESTDKIIEWPLHKLPKGMQIGDIAFLNLAFPLEIERKEEIELKQKEEEKYEKMRNLLEDLVN